MRGKLRLVLFIALLISLSFYYIINQSNKDNNIEQTIQEEDELVEEIIEDPEESDESNVDDEVDKEKLTTKLSDIVKHTFEYLFTKEFHVVAIGDSLTQGVGDSTKKGGYIGILDETINQHKQIVSFDNFGKSGRRTDQLLEFLDDPEVVTAIEGTDVILKIGRASCRERMYIYRRNVTRRG